MNSKIKTKWLTALRSGKYKQAQGRLKRKDAYCCLGVLCDLAAEQGKGAWKMSMFSTDRSGLATNMILPPDIADWAGLSQTDPKINLDGIEAGEYTTSTISFLNDQGWTFDQIADIIEAQL